MTDIVAEAPVEPVRLPEAAVPPSAEAEPAPSLAETPAPERALPEIEHPVGRLRQAVLDHLLDTAEAGAQSVSQILASMPAGTTRGAAESAIKREFDCGRIERVAPGLYTLAKPKPAAPAEPKPVRSDGTTDEQWLSWIEEWKSTGEWKGLGNPPDQSGHLVPLDVISKHNERVRKREERRREREAAAARQAAADAALRDKLIAATHGNCTAGPALDDVSPVRAALEFGVPLERILVAIRHQTDLKCDPRNRPPTSWRDPRLLEGIAEFFCRTVVVPGLVDAWAKAGLAPTKPAADDTADTPVAPQGVVGAPNASPGAQELAEPETAPAPPAGPSGAFSDDALGQMAAGLMMARVSRE